jgi:hypothetical protein
MNPDGYIIEIHLRKRIVGWGNLELSEEGRREVEGYPGIRYVAPDGPMVDH